MNDLGRLSQENKRLSQDNQSLLDIIKRKDEQIKTLQDKIFEILSEKDEKGDSQ